MKHNKKIQSGIALMEALIALGVLALGVLALLVVQIRLYNEAQMSVGRNQATQYIDDLAERIKANPQGWDTNSPVLTSNMLNFGAQLTPPIPNCGDISTPSVTCTQDQMAIYDLWRFKTNLRQLPLGDAAISIASTTTTTMDQSQIAVRIAWRRNEKAATPSDPTSQAAFEALLNDTFDANPASECPSNFVCHLAYIPRWF